ncbi:MAG: hypothetical protein K2W81_03120 [Sphingomonas sp.]|uniref:hypothetical protein n=1 Tax=Sphingomonas sp. TaxID=28214 RepID=UPI0025FC3F36|nr:hypothetical protein [Sphingomonas sp.]MBY0282940.1 hypothetical protein [Sphingomonas sp.]
MHRFVLIALLFATGCAATPREAAIPTDRKVADETKLARLLRGYTPGPAQSCLPAQRTQYHTEGVGDTLLYSANRDVIYRNDTSGCSGVARGDALITSNFSTRLCRGQIAATVDTFTGFQSSSCALGDFVPYRKNP